MLGAILGDIVGSPYEFDHNNYKHKDFPLLSEKSHFTDDTVMTAAVAVGLIDGKGLPERTFCAVQHEMRFWGREYPHAGYGGIAEAFYGMPQELRDETLKRLPEDIREGYELFRWNIGQR